MERHDRIDRRMNGHDNASMTDLLRRLAQESADLVRHEVNLARLELKETAREMARQSVKLTIGIGLLAVGGLALTAFLILVVGLLLGGAYWAGALIVGAIFAIVGGLMAKSAVNDMKKQELKPEETIETLKEDRQWLRQEARDFEGFKGRDEGMGESGEELRH